MKTVYRWLKAILCSAMLALLASCASTNILNDSTVGNMSVKEARNVLTSKMKGEGNLIYYAENDHEINDVRANSNRMIIIEEDGKQNIFNFKDIPQIAIGVDFWASKNYILLTDQVKYRTYGFHPTSIANALYVLKRNAIKEKKGADEFDANFATSLADYRNKAASNAALPEEANKYKVQAEDAVRDKQFGEAADLYAEALKIAPWWPTGHFNRALVLGETGDYEMAVRDMKHYLQLVPDAPNARAAQDKIYQWGRKAGEGN